MTRAKPGKSGRVGQVRCPNCFERFRPLSGAEKASCPAWSGKLAKIRKPVWESWDSQLAEAEGTRG